MQCGTKDIDRIGVVDIPTSIVGIMERGYRCNLLRGPPTIMERTGKTSSPYYLL